jgi:EmrB/QacA subfamily drug resistance transporter
VTTELSSRALELPDVPTDSKYAWRVFSVTSLGAVLTAVNASSLDVALPTVSKHFHATPAQASWFLLSYMLINTIMILVFGRLADMLGRRRLYLIGLAFFTVASLGCGFAPSAAWLIVLRGLQALGAASVITNTTALIVDSFPPAIVGVGIGMNMTVLSAAQIAGPLVGGAMATFFGWRAVFLFNVPTGVIAFVWGIYVLRSAPEQHSKERFDVYGAIASASFLGGLVVCLSEGGARSWSDPLVAISAAVAIVALPVFIWLQRRRHDALIDLNLVLDRNRAAAYASAFVATSLRFAIVLLASLFLQAAAGLNAFDSGLRVMPTALGMLVASPISGRLIRSGGTRTLSRVGILLSSISVLSLAVTLSPHMSALLMGAELFGLGLGTGLFMPANTSAIMAGVPAHRRGVANGIRSTLQNTGTVVGTALSLALATSALPIGEKRAAYAGTLQKVNSAELHVFVHGCQLALYVLFGLSVLGAILQWAEGDPTESRKQQERDAAAADI